jgi:hypothetical protein
MFLFFEYYNYTLNYEYKFKSEKVNRKVQIFRSILYNGFKLNPVKEV